MFLVFMCLFPSVVLKACRRVYELQSVERILCPVTL